MTGEPQLELLPSPGADVPVYVRGRDDGTIEGRFRRFHSDNPDVYAELRDLALDGIRAGRKKLGVAQLFEVLRWYRSLHTVGETLKLNNDYRSRYARLLMAQEPELADVFNLRSLHDDEEP